MKKKIIYLVILIFGCSLLLTSCAMKQCKTSPAAPEPTKANFQKPQISLKSFQVSQYDGYWYYSKKIEPTKGDAGNHGAPLPMSFLFEIDNPNPYPVLIKDMTFTVNFEGFDVQTVNLNDAYWIPAQKTDHIRANAFITTRNTLLSLLVTGRFKLKEKGMSHWEALERWWTKVPNLEMPIKVKDGSATCEADGITKIQTFSMTY